MIENYYMLIIFKLLTFIIVNIKIRMKLIDFVLKKFFPKTLLDNYPETYFFVIFWTRATNWRTATKNQNGSKTSEI